MTSNGIYKSMFINIRTFVSADICQHAFLHISACFLTYVGRLFDKCQTKKTHSYISI